MKTNRTNLVKSIVSKVPLVMVALPASYGVASFESSVYPAPWNWVLGAAFESVYLGAIFLAENKSRGMFFTTVSIAVVCGILYNTLHAADVEGILLQPGDLWHWLLAAVHGAPLSAIGLAFAMLLHFGSDAAQPTDGLEIMREGFAEALPGVIAAEVARQVQAQQTSAGKIQFVSKHPVIKDVPQREMLMVREPVGSTAGAADSGGAGLALPGELLYPPVPQNKPNEKRELVRKLKSENPTLTNQQIADRADVSLRSVVNYLKD